MATKHPLNLLPWYLNGQLDDGQQQQVSQHLQQCFYCQQEYLQLEQLQLQLRKLWSDARPGELELKRLLKEIQPHGPDVTPDSPRFRWSPRRSRQLVLALVLLVQVLAVIWFVQRAPVSVVAPRDWHWYLYQTPDQQLSPLIRQTPPRLLLGASHGQWLLAWPDSQPPAWLERERAHLTPTDASALTQFLAH